MERVEKKLGMEEYFPFHSRRSIVPGYRQMRTTKINSGSRQGRLRSVCEADACLISIGRVVPRYSPSGCIGYSRIHEC
jgi:hypothetical protein